jgi:hypothetical protein
MMTDHAYLICVVKGIIHKTSNKRGLPNYMSSNMDWPVKNDILNVMISCQLHEQKQT